MSLTTLIANVGGMLGLCFGLSFVSMAEILFIFGSLIWAWAWRFNVQGNVSR